MIAAATNNMEAGKRDDLKTFFAGQRAGFEIVLKQLERELGGGAGE